MQRDIIRIIQRQICRRILFDLNSSAANTVLIAGMGRSGTTWVADIINSRNDYRMIFEPFHPQLSHHCRHFLPCQYLRPHNQDPTFVEPIKAALTGRVRSLWSDSQNRKLLSRKRLVKAIHANLLLYWIRRNFPEIRIILLMRNPCAVAASALRLGWNANRLNILLRQSDLVADFLSPFAEVMRKKMSTFDRHVFLWCVNNYVPLRQFRQDKIYVAFYENFCLKPMHEIRHLYGFLNKPFDPSVLRHFSLPYTRSRPDSPIVTGGNIVNSWKKIVTEDQIQRTHEILSGFGLDRLYSEDFLPTVPNGFKALAMMKFING